MSKEVFKNMLTRSMEDKQIIGITTYKNNDKFWAGYVLDYNDDFVIFQHISKYGLKDGLNIEAIKNIESIETDDDYLNGIWLLVDNPLQEQRIRTMALPTDNNWQLDILKANPTPGKIIDLEISTNVVVCGIVLEFDDEFFSIRKVSSAGLDEGIAIYKVDDINAIQFDTIEARKRQKLYEWNLGGKAK